GRQNHLRRSGKTICRVESVGGQLSSGSFRPVHQFHVRFFSWGKEFDQATSNAGLGTIEEVGHSKKLSSVENPSRAKKQYRLDLAIILDSGSVLALHREST